MTAKEDPALVDWLRNAQSYGGHFLSAIASAGLCADNQNYPILRPVLLVMKQKYSKYGRGWKPGVGWFERLESLSRDRPALKEGTETNVSTSKEDFPVGLADV